MSEYYDLDGNPIEMMEWARLVEGKHAARRASGDGWSTPDTDYSRVALDEIGDVRVSTVWLGLNHNWHPDGPPLIFETMVFGGDHDEYQMRYSTKHQALEGHRFVVKCLKKGLPLP